MPRCFINAIRGYREGKYWPTDGDNRNVMTTRSGRAIPKVPTGKKKFRTGVTSSRPPRPPVRSPVELHDPQKVTNTKVILYRSLSHMSIVTRFQLQQDGVPLEVTENPLDAEEIIEDSPLEYDKKFELEWFSGWSYAAIGSTSSQSSGRCHYDSADESTINGVPVKEEEVATWMQSESTEDSPFYLCEEYQVTASKAKPSKSVSQKRSSKKKLLNKSTKSKSTGVLPENDSQRDATKNCSQSELSKANAQDSEPAQKEKRRGKGARKSKSKVKQVEGVSGLGASVESVEVGVTEVVPDLTRVEVTPAKRVQSIRAKLDALLAESLAIPSRLQHQQQQNRQELSAARVSAQEGCSHALSAAPQHLSRALPSTGACVQTTPVLLATAPSSGKLKSTSANTKQTFAAHWTPRVVLRDTDVFRGDTFTGKSQNPPKPTVISTVIQPDSKKTLFTIGLNSQCSPVNFTIHPSDLVAYKKAKMLPSSSATEPGDDARTVSDSSEVQLAHGYTQDKTLRLTSSPGLLKSPNPLKSAEADLDRYLASSQNILKDLASKPGPSEQTVNNSAPPSTLLASPKPGPSCREPRTPVLGPGTPRVLLREVLGASPCSVGMRTPGRRWDALSSVSSSQSGMEDPEASPISSIGSPARSLLEGRSGTDSFTDESGQESEEEVDVQQLIRDWHCYGVDAQGQRIHRCTLCLKVFTVYAAYRSHANSHIRARNRCPVCSKVFSRSWLLKGHMRVHTGEKPYRCRQAGCDKAFADKSNLRSHMLIHTTKDKSYVCTKCNRAFAQKRYLHKHKLEVCKI